jgi:hypothetical protein
MGIDIRTLDNTATKAGSFKLAGWRGLFAVVAAKSSGNPTITGMENLKSRFGLIAVKRK